MNMNPSFLLAAVTGLHRRSSDEGAWAAIGELLPDPRGASLSATDDEVQDGQRRKTPTQHSSEEEGGASN